MLVASLRLNLLLLVLCYYKKILKYWPTRFKSVYENMINKRYLESLFEILKFRDVKFFKNFRKIVREKACPKLNRVLRRLCC